MASITSPISRRKGPKDWTEEWLDACSGYSPEAGGTLYGNEEYQGFAARLSTLCLQQLRALYLQECEMARNGDRAFCLREEFHKLYLWGEPFGDGKLDRALDYSEDLRDDILDCLCGIGRIIVRGKIVDCRYM